MKARLLALLAATSLALPLYAQPVFPAPDTAPPPIQREMRGVWIATVGNMDWPSRPGLSTWDQQAEMIAILNRAVAAHLNAVIFQVRPEADAFYESAYEPWSAYLSGTMGRAPEPFYDPLSFLVREAHARGLEVHAWFNPYRARFSPSPGDAAPGHVTRTDAAAVLRYGAYDWMDPSDSGVVERSVRAILDVTRRYDIDAIHLDDYFYPYRESDRSGRNIEFPDQASYDRYRRSGGTLGRSDWRRSNVDHFVQRIGTEIHTVKPWVRFGVSPFGIWRPGSPPSVRGLDSYEEIFADSRKWIQAGWVDYLVPQLYWPLGRPQQDFSELLGWWIAQNGFQRNVWAGLNAALAYDPGTRGHGASQILDQIRLTRAQTGATGDVLFNMKVLMQDPDSIVERLARDVYGQPALVPASSWLEARVPTAPVVQQRIDAIGGDMMLDLSVAAGDSLPSLWVVQTRTPSAWTTQILSGRERAHLIAPRDGQVPLDVRVYAVSRVGTLSLPARIIPHR